MINTMDATRDLIAAGIPEQQARTIVQVFLSTQEEIRERTAREKSKRNNAIGNAVLWMLTGAIWMTAILVWVLPLKH